LLPFPLVSVLAYGLIYFFLHYYLYKGAQLFLMVLLVLTTTILPLVGNAIEDVSRTVAFNIL
jgi:hypothetical protein